MQLKLIQSQPQFQLTLSFKEALALTSLFGKFCGNYEGTIQSIGIFDEFVSAFEKLGVDAVCGPNPIEIRENSLFAIDGYMDRLPNSPEECNGSYLF